MTRCPIHDTDRACACGTEVTEGNLREVVAVAGWKCERGHRIVGTPTIPKGGLAARCHLCHGGLTRQGIIFYANGRRVYPVLLMPRPKSGDLYRYFAPARPRQVGESE